MQNVKKLLIVLATGASALGTQSFAPQKAVVETPHAIAVQRADSSATSAPTASSETSATSSSTEAALLNGKNQDIYVSQGQPITVDQILGGIKAKDMFGADVQYTVPDADKAAVNFNQVGDYVLHLTATDAYGQTATATVTIKVIQSQGAPAIPDVPADGKDPDVLDGKYKVGYSKGITADYLAQKIKVADPDGTVASVTYAVDGTAIDADHPYALTADQAKGTATINVTVTAVDNDGNMAVKDIPFVVVDDVAPVLTKADGSDIADDETVNVGFEAFKNTAQAAETFLDGYEAVDAVEGSTAIQIADFPVKEAIRFQDGAADYTVHVTSADKAGNKASKAVKLHITTSGDGTVTPTDPNKPGSGNDSNGDGIPDNYTAPVFYISDTLIAATADNPLTSAQISNIVNKAIFASEGANPLDLKIEDAAYIDHATESGIYDVNFSYVSGKEGADTSVRTQGKIKVMVTGNDIVVPKNGWEAFCRWFTDGFQCLGNWITGHGWKTNYQLRIETYSK